jgi:hypothetical protein
MGRRLHLTPASLVSAWDVSRSSVCFLLAPLLSLLLCDDAPREGILVACFGSFHTWPSPSGLTEQAS